MIISTTEIQGYDRCRRMWSLTSFNGQSLTRAIHRVALEAGTLWHAVQADWMSHPELDPCDIFEARYVELITLAKESYRKRNGMMPMAAEMEPIIEAGVMVKAMVKNYRDFYGKPLPDGFRCVSPEQTAVVPIPHSEESCRKCNGYGNLPGTPLPCDECNGTGLVSHSLECTFDAVLADDQDQLFVLERKTYGARPKELSLYHNFQFKTYTWALTQLQMGHVAGLLYDGAWKRDQPPRPRAGKTYDLSDLFLRTPILFNPYELQELEQVLAIKARRMYESMHNMQETMLDYNRRWESCYDCSVEDLCTAITRDEDFDYIKRKYFTIRERTPAFREEVATSDD